MARVQIFNELETFTAMLKLSVFVILVFSMVSTWGAETCSRVATINYQEVLVDVSSTNKGEGLRYYLQKDEVAKELLNEYQLNDKPSWKTAALSTLGTGMLLGGLLRTGTGEGESFLNRNFLIFGGLSFIGLSYLISHTNEYNNEYLLRKSVEEYNKRNTPKIFFAPTDSSRGSGLGVGLSQEF